MNQILINYITGVTYPVNVYVADEYGNNTTFVDSVTGPVPPSVVLTCPPLFNGAEKVMLILMDTSGCGAFQIINCNDFYALATENWIPFTTQEGYYIEP